MVARVVPLAGVEHVHDKQLAVVFVREVEIVAQGLLAFLCGRRPFIRFPAVEKSRRIGWAAGTQSVRRTSLTRHTSMVRPSDTEPPSKAAATVTRHPFILGSLRVAFALGASRPAWLTAFASDSTVMDLAGSADPFTTVTAVAACG